MHRFDTVQTFYTAHHFYYSFNFYTKAQLQLTFHNVYFTFKALLRISLANGKNKFAAITQLTTVKWRLQCKSCTSLHSFVPSKLLLLRYKCIETPVYLTKLVLKHNVLLFGHVGVLFSFSAAHVDRRAELVAKIPTSSDLRVHVNCDKFTR